MQKPIAFAFLAVVIPWVSIVGDESAPVVYSQHVAPLLKKYCLACHSRTEPENGLSLQTPGDIRKGGENGPVLNSDALADSRLLQVLLSPGDDHMPPASEAQLTTEELGLFRAWIEGGSLFDGTPADLLSLPAVPLTTDRIVRPIMALAVHPDGRTAVSGGYRAIGIHSPRGRIVDDDGPGLRGDRAEFLAHAAGGAAEDDLHTGEGFGP